MFLNHFFQSCFIVLDEILELEDAGWIDDYTRAVFLEFTLYNANVDIFTVAVYLFEFTNIGAVHASHHEFSSSLNHHYSSYEAYLAVCEVTFVIFNLLFLYSEIKRCRKVGKSEYFADFWTVVQIIQIALAFLLCGVFVKRTLSVASVMADLKISDKAHFINFYVAIFWDYAMTYVMAALVTVVILQTVKLLSFNRKISIVTGTFHAIKGTIVAFVLIFSITSVGFASMGYMLFKSLFSSYSSFTSAWISNMLLLLRPTDYVFLYDANRVLGPAFMVTLMTVILIGIIAIWKSILNMGRILTNKRLKRIQNQIEIIDYVSEKLKDSLDIK